MTKKKKIKFAIKEAVKEHYNNKGFTATADKMLKQIFDKIEKIYQND